ncbi:hypothetical protein JRO89_XS02G0133900 [Xanthoceras sorbifolium]|uniref:Aldehyde dehydrogenase domain-containing protein n=1 Tax=Xanthoceras sorbifolium TaxID=99658 RepID=A0ABQ8IFU9_9ROSI|nr:hypothetical protein JRO89_XS02G0133900 [Xanthoceras sorbifolium]
MEACASFFFPIYQEDKLVERAKALKVTAGFEADADLGPVISKQAKEGIGRLIQAGFQSGAKLLLDGRNIVWMNWLSHKLGVEFYPECAKHIDVHRHLVPGYEHGNFIGATILSDVTDNMECYKEEMFGPVLLCMQADSIDEAINIVNRNRYGNGASIFTTSGLAARKFQTEVEVGQVGINVPISVVPPFSSFTSSKSSFAGDLNFDGKAGIQFYTQVKRVTQQWKDLLSNDFTSLQFPCSNSDEASMQLPSS